MHWEDAEQQVEEGAIVGALLSEQRLEEGGDCGSTVFRAAGAAARVALVECLLLSSRGMQGGRFARCGFKDGVKHKLCAAVCGEIHFVAMRLRST